MAKILSEPDGYNRGEELGSARSSSRSIPHLHRLLGRLAELGRLNSWSNEELGVRLRVCERTVRRWMHGDTRISPRYEQRVRRLLAKHFL